jgi:hypothetical protein
MRQIKENFPLDTKKATIFMIAFSVVARTGIEPMIPNAFGSNEPGAFAQQKSQSLTGFLLE